MELVLGVFVAAFVGAIVALVVYARRLAARTSPEGALAEASVGADSTFALTVTASEALDVFVRYELTGHRMSGGGMNYGAVLRLDVEREVGGDGYRAAPETFVHRHEYLIGRAQRAFGEVPLAHSLEAGPVVRAGTTVRRGLLMVRVPAGGALRAWGKVQMSGATECQHFSVFVKARA